MSNEISETIDSLLEQQQYRPDVHLLTMALMDQFGGPVGLAQCLHEDYTEARAKGAINTCSFIMRGIIDLLKMTGAKMGPADPVAGLSPEELKSAVKRLLSENGNVQT